jgi:FHA domain-containing protein/regulatory Fis family protein
MLRLLVTHGDEEHVFAIPEGEAKLGRSGENDIVLKIRGVSRKHALLRPCSGGVEVCDLRSTNGLLVEGTRVKRGVLTAGLRLQIGAAWLEVEEISTSEEPLVRLQESSSERSARPPSTTAKVAPQKTPGNASPEEAALHLAYHIAQVGVGVPEQRADLLLRIKATLGAEAFATLDTSRFGRLRIWESVGTFSPAEERLLTSLAEDRRIAAREQVMLKRAAKTLIAGKDSWFLAAKFSEGTLAREGWRKEFLRFLALQFFMPVRSLYDVDYSEASRVLALARNNKTQAAKLLGISRTSLYDLLELFGLTKR